MPLAHDPPGSFSPGIEDQHPPAAIVPADLRAREMDGAVALRCRCIIPEERAGFGALGKDAFVMEEFVLVRVDSDRGLLACVLVVDDEPVIPKILVYDVDEPQVAATLPTLLAFERHSPHLPLPGFAFKLLNLAI